MKYKLMAVDMDDTLLDNRGRISEKTVKIIRNIVQKGVVFTICTGRPIQGVEEYCSLLGLKGPVITYNGAVIVDTGTQEVLFAQELTRDDAGKILELGRRYDTTMCIWADGRLYGNKMNDRIYDYQKLSGGEPQPAGDFEELLDMGITKILWYDEAGKIERFRTQLSPDMFSETAYCTSKPVFLEFFSSRVSKGAALAKIGDMYGIRREEMVAVGDGLNDLSMIQYAGMGVAMGNAQEEVKRAAQFVTSSNDQEGVRKVIETFWQ